MAEDWQEETGLDVIETESTEEGDNYTRNYDATGGAVLSGGTLSSSLFEEAEVSNEKLRIIYRRSEPAFNALNKWTSDATEKGFTIESENSSFVEKVRQKMDEVDFNQALADANFYANLDGFAGMGYILNDPASDPSEGVETEQVDDIAGINVLTDQDVEEVYTDEDPNSENYTDIEKYDLSSDSATDEVHGDRVYHFTPYRISKSPRGISFLEPTYTSLKVFENIKFGTGQAFYVGGTGFPTLRVDGLSNMSEEDKKATKNEFMSDVLEKPGIVLDKEKSDIAFEGAGNAALNPSDYFDPIFDTLGISFGSKQLLIGSAAGELKQSEENKKQYFGDVHSYQKNKLQNIVEDFIQRCIDYGLVEEPSEGYEIRWEELYERDDEREAEIQEIKARAFRSLATSGLPMDLAAQEADLSEDTVEELQSRDIELQPNQSSGQNNNPPTGDTEDFGHEKLGDNDFVCYEYNASFEKGEVNDFYCPMCGEDLRDDVEDGESFFRAESEIDTQAHAELMNTLEELDGFDPESYWKDRPVEEGDFEEWEEGEVEAFRDFRDSLLERFERTVENIVDAVDKSRVEGDFEETDKEHSKISRFVFDSEVQKELESMEKDMNEITQTKLRAGYYEGADRARAELGASAVNRKIFDKHKQEVVDNTMDKWMRPAYADTKDSISEKINDQIEKNLKDQDAGIGDLKRSIRELKGGDISEDYRFERIARTETGRIRNQAYVDEAGRRGRNMFDWVGPAISSATPPVCQDLTASSPVTKKELMRRTNGGVPHINCRRTAAVHIET